MGDYPAFKKIPRLYREVTITEKIDGSNGLIYIEDKSNWFDPTIDEPYYNEELGISYFYGSDDQHTLTVRAGSKNRWLSPTKGNDNFGFAAWVRDNAETLLKLGPGHHYGEWFGAGIQRRYGLDEKYFALFNTARYQEFIADGNWLGTLTTVPTIFVATHSDKLVQAALDRLELGGSIISGSLGVQAFQKAEGVIVRHSQSGALYKVLLENDDVPKSHVKLVGGNISVSNTGAAIATGGGSAVSGISIRGVVGDTAVGVNYGNVRVV